MEKDRIAKLKMDFENQAYQRDGVEFWFARDLQVLLDYGEWRNFLNVIDKAKVACTKSRQKLADHFVDVNKMVKIGSEADRSVDDIILTRYACYLVAQNGDSRKEQIAFAQSYFAVQTRKLELIEERIGLIERVNARKRLAASETELSKLIFERGVDEAGFARIRSRGDRALFGGLNTFQMKGRLGVPPKRALADFLPTITITAKSLATEITNFNMKRDDLQGERKIAAEHVKNNSDVRKLLAKSNIVPEMLPPEEDLRRLEKRAKAEERNLADTMQKKL